MIEPLYDRHRPAQLISRRKFRLVGKCEWCGEDDRSLKVSILHGAWLCAACTRYADCSGQTLRGWAGTSEAVS